MSFFQILGMGLSLMGGNEAARAQEQESKQTAESMITDRIIGEAQAAQQQNMRYQQYFDDLASNEATLLFNRDIDSSLEAFFEGQKAVAFDDLAVIQTQP